MATFAREAREEVLVAKAQCEERQRVLDEMSRELQESGWDGTPILDRLDDPIRHDCDWSPMSWSDFQSAALDNLQQV